MKTIVISRGTLEIARTQLRKSFIAVGRSPTCDVVLRATGVRPFHFLIEWLGEGQFDPSKGMWTIIDISSNAQESGGAASGTGAVIQGEKPLQLGGFEFKTIESRFDSAEVIGGGIRSDLGSVSKPLDPTVCEFLQMRSDSGAIEEISHFHRKPNQTKVVYSHLFPGMVLEWSGNTQTSPVTISLGKGPEKPENIDIFIKGEKQPAQNSFQITPGDLAQVKMDKRDLFFRFVEPIEVPKVPHPFLTDQNFKNALALGIPVFALMSLLFSMCGPAKVEPPTEAPRVARVEVAAPASEASSAAPAEAPEANEQAPSSGDVQAPAANLTQSAPAKAPSHAPAKDVTRIGLLGALKSSGAKGPGIRADQIREAPSDSLSSKIDASNIGVRKANTGEIGTGSQGSVKGTGTDLASASSNVKNGGSGSQALGKISQGTGSALSSGSLVGTGTNADGSGFGVLDNAGVSVEGGLTKDIVRRVVNAHKSQILACYERALLVNPKLSGRVVYDWLIGADGPVRSVSIIQNQTGSEVLAGCVLQVVQGMGFPKAPNGKATRVKYPFVFQRRN